MKMMKKLVLVLAITMLVLLAACGKAEPEAEEAPVSEAPTTAEISESSILYFNNDEGSAKLAQFFADGNVPEEVTFMYDQMGANPEITVTDPETVKELYQRLALVNVVGETDESITDCYHYINFKLADDCNVHFSFEGSKIWCYEKQNYSIEDSGRLFQLMEELTEDYWEQEG